MSDEPEINLEHLAAALDLSGVAVDTFGGTRATCIDAISTRLPSSLGSMSGGGLRAARNLRPARRRQGPLWAERGDRDDVDSVGSSACVATACNHAEDVGLTMFGGIDVGGESKEGGGSLVDSFGVELHLEGAPAVAAEADDGIDLVTVGVAPGRDVATQRLSANAKVSDRECLEMVAGGVEIGAHLGAADV